MNIIAISIAACFIFAPLIGLFANTFSIVSGNVTTRWAATPKPLLGGISMFMAILFALIYSGIPFADHPILSCAGLFTMIGIYDDIAALSPKKKLALQFCGAFISAKFFLLLPFSPWFVLAILWIVFFTNAFNIIDGMDGVALTFATLLLTWLTILGNPHVFSYAVLGVCIGFLPYNFRNASLYIGDSGSHFLGSAIAILVLPSDIIGIGIPSFHFTDCLPLLYPVSDLLFVSVTRSLRHKSILTAGTDHIAHRLARIIGEKKTLYILSGITFFCIAISLVSHNIAGRNNYYVIIPIAFLGIASLLWLHKKTSFYFIKKNLF